MKGTCFLLVFLCCFFLLKYHTLCCEHRTLYFHSGFSSKTALNSARMLSLVDLEKLHLFPQRKCSISIYQDIQRMVSAGIFLLGVFFKARLWLCYIMDLFNCAMAAVNTLNKHENTCENICEDTCENIWIYIHIYIHTYFLDNN